MAYRQLCSVTFAVLGLVAFGCGGNTNTTAGTGSSPTGEQPPANADQAPSSSDQAPNGTDQAPPNTDAPPPSADAPAGTGGGLGALCEQFCDSLTNVAGNCGRGMGSLNMDNICSDSQRCVFPAGFAVCETQIANLFKCAIDNLQALCAVTQQQAGDSGGGPGQDPAPLPQQTSPCQDVLKAFTTCAEANHLGEDMTTDPMPVCNSGNACSDCLCTAAGDATRAQACANLCATPTP